MFGLQQLSQLKSAVGSIERVFQTVSFLGATDLGPAPREGAVCGKTDVWIAVIVTTRRRVGELVAQDSISRLLAPVLIANQAIHRPERQDHARIELPSRGERNDRGSIRAVGLLRLALRRADPGDDRPARRVARRKGLRQTFIDLILGRRAVRNAR